MATKEEIQKGITAANEGLIDIEHGNVPTGQTREQALTGIKSNLQNLSSQVSSLPIEPATEPTMSDLGLGSTDTTLSDLENNELKRLQGVAATAPSQEDIYGTKLKTYQQEIDALNAAAAARKAEVAASLQKTGEQSLAQAGAIGARRGLLGSTFQAGTESGIAAETTKNIREAQSVVEQQYAEKIATLRGQARQSADEEYQTKLKAYEEGGSALIKFLQEKKSRRADAVSSLVSSLIDEDYNTSDLKQLARDRGIPENELLEAYKVARSAYKKEAEKADLEKRKTEAEIADIGKFTLGEGQIRYDESGRPIAYGPAKETDVIPTSDEWSFLIQTAASSEGSNAANERVQKELASLANSGNYQELLTRTKNSVKKSLGTTGSNELTNAEVQIKAIERMKSALDKYEESGGNVGFLKGKTSDITKKLGQLTTDPEFATIATDLTAAFNVYRQSMTGAAFGAKENAEYKKVYPSTDKSYELNSAVMEGLTNYLRGNVDATYSTYLGPAYDKLKSATEGQNKSVPVDGLSDEEAYQAYLKIQNQ